MAFQVVEHVVHAPCAFPPFRRKYNLGMGRIRDSKLRLAKTVYRPDELRPVGAISAKLNGCTATVIEKVGNSWCYVRELWLRLMRRWAAKC